MGVDRGVALRAELAVQVVVEDVVVVMHSC
jgi:hypothetical protein